MRVALLTGCAQRVLDPAINEATIRVLTRHGVEVGVVKGGGCCGALQHHMGQEDASHAMAAANIRACGLVGSSPFLRAICKIKSS